MDTEKRLAKRVAFLRKSIYISYGNINEAMNTLSCGSLYEAISHILVGVVIPVNLYDGILKGY